MRSYWTHSYSCFRGYVIEVRDKQGWFARISLHNDVVVETTTPTATNTEAIDRLYNTLNAFLEATR